MFTGIIESTGTIHTVTGSGTNKTFLVDASLAAELKVDQSLAHNGVCLTVEMVGDGHYQVTAIAETLAKTTLGNWAAGTPVNLERCLHPSGRVDGHFVQGHTDTTGRVIEKTNQDGSWLFRIAFDPRFAPLLIEKGSVALDGISLTVFSVTREEFSVAIVPYTYEHTNLSATRTGDRVNLEFDMLGKYIVRWAETSRAGNVL